MSSNFNGLMDSACLLEILYGMIQKCFITSDTYFEQMQYRVLDALFDHGLFLFWKGMIQNALKIKQWHEMNLKGLPSSGQRHIDGTPDKRYLIGFDTLLFFLATIGVFLIFYLTWFLVELKVLRIL